MSTGEHTPERGWNPHSKIFVAGHAGLIGAAVLRALISRGHEALLTVDRTLLDLTNQEAVESYFEREQPEYVVLAAGRCTSAREEKQFPADVIRDHLTMQANVIDSAYSFGARKLIFLATRASIVTRAEPENVSDGFSRLIDAAKATGVRMCSAYRRQFGFGAVAAILPTIYGSHDRFSSNRPDCVAGFMYALSNARLRREFSVAISGDPEMSMDLLHADDLASALLCLLVDEDEQEPIALVPASSTIKLKDLVNKISALVQYEGRIHFYSNAFRAPGVPRESGARLRALGWHPRIRLDDGLRDTYAWFIANQQHLRL